MAEDQKKENGAMLLTTSKVAAILGVSPRTVQRWADAGYIKAFGIKHRRFTQEEVDRLKQRFQRQAE